MRRSWIPVASIVVGMLVLSAQGAVMSTEDVPLGNSGWKVNGPSYYDLNVDVQSEGENGGIKWVSIIISKNFRFGPDPFTGDFPSITLTFSQVDDVAAEDLATRIIILEENIANSTGSDWTDFHWLLFRHGIAGFNQEMTNPTTDVQEYGWLISPFTQYTWEQNPALDVEMLSVEGGVVLDNESFHAGTGSGTMVIDIDLGLNDAPIDAPPSPAIFKLSQMPTPEPATLTLLAVGGVALLRRRR